MAVYDLERDPTSDAPRSRRRAGARARTLSIRRLSHRELVRGSADYPPGINEAAPRPRTWGECQTRELGTAHEPCPYVSCKYHLALDVNERTGSIKENHPGLELDELPATCALRVAEDGGATLEDLGSIMNLTRERIRQIEGRALVRLGRPLELVGGVWGLVFEEEAGSRT